MTADPTRMWVVRRRDRGEHHVGGGQGPGIGVVLADPEEVDPDLVGEDAVLDEVPDRLRVRERAIVLVVCDVAEGVEPEGRGHAASARRASSNSGRRSATPNTGPPGSRSRPALRLLSRTVS